MIALNATAHLAKATAQMAAAGRHGDGKAASADEQRTQAKTLADQITELVEETATELWTKRALFDEINEEYDRLHPDMPDGGPHYEAFRELYLEDLLRTQRAITILTSTRFIAYYRSPVSCSTTDNFRPDRLSPHIALSISLYLFIYFVASAAR